MPQMATTEECERQYLAEVLHDGVGQVLSLCRIKLDMLSHTLSHIPQASELANIRDLLDQTIDETHTLVSGTSPLVLHEFGLTAAIRALAKVFQQTYGLSVRIMADQQSEGDHLSAESRNVFYTAVRELLTNIRKYSGARQATVTLSENGAQFVVRVKDNGRGFDPGRAHVCPTAKGGFGLLNISRRCEQIGAQFSLRSSPGRGTIATLTAPLV